MIEPVLSPFESYGGKLLHAFQQLLIVDMGQKPLHLVAVPPQHVYHHQ
jgi:hypothetical protein